MNGILIRSEILSKAGAINGVSLRVEDKPGYFSMRRNGKPVGPEAENRREFFNALGFGEDQVAQANQVHSANIVTVDSPGVSSETDALVTREGNILLTISVADCVPILIFDPRKRVAAAVHAGWRGTVKKITAKVVRYLYDEFGSSPEDLVAFVGPSAGACCYEVGHEVALNFQEKFLKKTDGHGRCLLDLKSANADQLAETGVRRRSMEVSGYCTICNTGFHSFRRDGESSGRMIAAIGFN